MVLICSDMSSCSPTARWEDAMAARIPCAAPRCAQQRAIGALPEAGREEKVPEALEPYWLLSEPETPVPTCDRYRKVAILIGLRKAPN